MRGKLRDKRSYTRHDSFKHEENEQRRPYKRDSRTALWDNQQLEDDEVYDEDELVEDEDATETEVKLPNKK